MDLPPDKAFEEAWKVDDTAGLLTALRAGANPNARLHDVPALYAASVLGREGLVDALLDAGADVDARHLGDDSTALMTVAALGVQESHTRILEKLIEHGADVNARERDGHAALDLSVASGNLRSAELLMAHGARGTRRTMIELARLRDASRTTDGRST